MNFRIAKLTIVLFAFLAAVMTFSFTAFGQAYNSNIFTAEQKDTFEDFKGKSLSTTANLNWTTENGNKITRTTVKNLPSYLLTANATNVDEKKGTFISAPKEALDVSGVGRLYFVVQLTSSDEKVEYTVKLSLSDGEDQLVCTAPLKGSSRQLISFEIEFFSRDRSLTEMSVEFLSDSEAQKISVSGPYYVDVDRTYVEDFCLGDLAMSADASYTDQGIFIADSTQKTGFSGRFVRSDAQSVNHLRLFATTGDVGGIVEIRYSYFNSSNGNLSTKSINVTLENNSKNTSYIVPLENAVKIISLSFLFDVGRSGGVTVHRIEAVDIYLPADQTPYGEIYQCTFSAGEGSITVTGKIFHDFLIKHTSYTLYLYRLETTETLHDVIEAGRSPVASAKMSSEFKINYNAGRQDKLSALSLYTIVASDGEDVIEILSPFHVDKKAVAQPSSQIKGLIGENVSCFSNMGVGVSAVDVYLDQLVGEKKSGYIYSLGDSHVYFNSDYVHALDKRIKNLCVSGCPVYLRLLIGSEGSNLAYAAKTADGTSNCTIDVSSEDARRDFFAAVDFLTSRYSDHKNGSINGYIIGTSANLPSELISISDLVGRVAATMEAVALSAAISMPDVRIILPISVDKSVDGYDAELFLHSLCNRIDEFGGLNFTVILESTRTYFKNGEMLDGSEFSSHLLSIDKMVKRLSAISRSYGREYFYLWEPVSSESDETLIAAYAYMYMSFLASDRCESFILDTSKSESSELVQLVKHIDSQKNENGELTNFVLGLLGAEKWSDVIPNLSDNIPVRSYLETLGTDDASATGTFVLFDFSSSFSNHDWFAGDGCLSISMISEAGEKYLCALMENYDDHSELMYHFDLPEKLAMAPYLALDFSVGAIETEKYSVKIIVRSGGNVLEAEEIFVGGEKCRFVLDISSVADGVDSISICANAVEGVSDNYNFKLSQVSVLSEKLTDEELSDAINEARTQAGHHAGTVTDSDERTPDYEFVIVLVGILVVCVIVAGIYDRNKE